MADSGLTFTGERFLPECEREIWYEHYHRYAMALHWVKDKQVLDVACGEGYGSHLLATEAASVLGVDVSAAAVEHAQRTYPHERLKFVEGNALQLPVADDSMDVVVSFETLEHLAEHEQLLAEFKRVLKVDGVLLISTPDKKEYSDKTGFNNEYHVKELYADEFANLLADFFDHTLWYGQKLMFSSNLWQLQQAPKTMQHDCMGTDERLADQPLFNPVYYVVVASQQPINPNQHPHMFSFTEQAEQVYGHYNAVIRAHIKAEQDCLQLQAKQQKWLDHPIIGRCIKWFGKE
ncbi:class I SAM-dependent methyltransferase [Marinicella meishanensis]|uniref:class I SAM-dependent methyltransferase n=1 Tax=Marinicella meishanensis TaxID=2873263 RepID=UPI001CBD4AE9|nr:class I SAM-dependent methyltransferase [Marinicella sp. NBU2979]